MKNINFYCIGVAASLLLLISQTSLAVNPRSQTTWKIVEKSLTELLNSGWKMISHDTNRAKTSGYQSQAAYDQQTHTFTLYKDGKYIICLISEPRPDYAFSYCRELN
jgi:hypothetical protein